MNTTKIISALLILLALLMGAMSVVLCSYAVTQKPILISEPVEAAATAKQLMSAVRAGDYQGAAACMQGNPDLGADREPEQIVGKLLWEEFLKSFTYETVGECYALDSGMALNMKVSYLDFDSAVSGMGKKVGEQLKKRAQEAEDPADIYDDENNYRQDLVDQVMEEVIKQAIAENGKMVTEELTIRLVHEDDQWRVVPDSSLIHVISGGTAG